MLSESSLRPSEMIVGMYRQR